MSLKISEWLRVTLEAQKHFEKLPDGVQQSVKSEISAIREKSLNE